MPNKEELEETSKKLWSMPSQNDEQPKKDDDRFVKGKAVDLSGISIGHLVDHIDKLFASLKTSMAELRDIMSRTSFIAIDLDALLLLFSSSKNLFGNSHNSLSIYYHIERYLSDLQKNGAQIVLFQFELARFHYLTVILPHSYLDSIFLNISRTTHLS